jgi:hypothetical protein
MSKLNSYFADRRERKRVRQYRTGDSPERIAEMRRSRGRRATDEFSTGAAADQAGWFLHGL